MLKENGPIVSVWSALQKTAFHGNSLFRELLFDGSAQGTRLYRQFRRKVAEVRLASIDSPESSALGSF